MNPTHNQPPVLQANEAWRCIEFISDLHLHPSEGATFEAWQRYLAESRADAIFMLGDLFEVWVGDDAMQHASSFEAECGRVLAAATLQRPLFFMHGNRDFLVSQAFFRQTCVQCLADPTVLHFGGFRYLLAHGDAFCLADKDYQAFRHEVRAAAWQRDFLAKPLPERIAIARQIRTHSEARKQQAHPMEWHDLDAPLVKQWLVDTQAKTLIHGHTHRPAEHDLGDGLQRTVLSDWDMRASPPRAQVLQLLRHPAGPPSLQRIDLAQGFTGGP